MKKRCLLLIWLLCLAIAAAAAEGIEWPPRGKTPGISSVDENSLTGTYLCGFSPEEHPEKSALWCFDIFPQGGRYDWSRAEPATGAAITQLTGEEALKDAFLVEQAVNSRGQDCMALRVNTGSIGEAGRASYRVDVESEHYYASVEFTAVLAEFSGLSVTFDEGIFDTVVGSELSVFGSAFKNGVHVTPGAKTGFSLLGPDGSDTGTDDYLLEYGGVFTAKKPGEYPMQLAVRVGCSEVTLTYPVTVRAASQQEQDSAWAAAWPPADKSQALNVLNYDDTDLNGLYFIHGAESGSVGLAPYYLSRSQEAFTSGEEEVTEYHVTFLSGDEGLRNVFIYDPSYGSRSGSLVFRPDLVTGPGTAELQIDMVSEHYYASITAKPVVLDANDVRIGLVSSEVNIPLNTPVAVEELYEKQQYVSVDPALSYSCSVSAENGAGELRTVEYSLERWSRFTAARPGDYPLILNVTIGQEGFRKSYPITVHASAETASAAVVGEAPPSTMVLEEQRAARQADRERLEKLRKSNEFLAETDTGVFLYTLNEKQEATIVTIPAMAKVTLPDQVDGCPVVAVGPRAMQNPWELEALTVPEGVRSIGSSAFSRSRQLRSLTLPESLTEIGDHAFSYCTALTELTLPAGLTREGIGAQAFRCAGLQGLSLADGTDLLAASAEAYFAGGLSTPGFVFSPMQNGLEYLLRADGGAVILSGDGTGAQLTVPETLNGYPVREIAESAFRSSADLTAVILPEGLEAIGDGAFQGCAKLTQAELPSTLKSVGARAFLGVAAEKIDLPEGTAAPFNWYASLERFDRNRKWAYQVLADQTARITNYTCVARLTFPSQVDGLPVTAIARADVPAGDKQLVKQITLPDTVREVEDSAFTGFSSLKKIKLSSALTSIGAGAFTHTALTEITVPEGVTAIGSSAFEGCKALRKATLPATLRELGQRAFYGTGLQDVAIPAAIRTVPEQAFAASALKNVRLPEGLEAIAPRAFENNRLAAVVFPESVVSIGDAAFAGNQVNRAVFNNPAVSLGHGVFGCWEDTDGQTGVGHDQYAEAYDPGTRRIPTLTVTCYPGSTAHLLYRYHSGRKLLSYGAETRVTAAASAVLEKGAYSPDQLIEELTVPEGVTEIAPEALAGLKTLRKVKLPSTLKRIGEGAFRDCVSLEEISLPAGITAIEADAFAGCWFMTKATLSRNVTAIGDRAFSGCQRLTTLNLPKGLKTIGEDAFAGTGLKNVTVPESVTGLGAGAFAGSTVAKVTLPKGITAVPDRLFEQCAALLNIQLPAAVTDVGDAAFRGCASLSSVTLPAGVRRLGAGAFAGCTGLTKLIAGRGSRLEEIGAALLDGHSARLTVTCVSGSAMEAYLKENYPGITLKTIK